MWTLISFAKSRTRNVCINELAKGPRTPTTIAKRSGEQLAHVSRALRELARKDLVVCLTPELTKNRFYKLTEKGKRVHITMGELEDLDK